MNLYAQKGTWGIGRFRLPDIGITEAIFGGRTTNPQLVNPKVAPRSLYNQSTPIWSPPPTAGRAKTPTITITPPGGGGSGDGGQPSNNGLDPHINPATGAWDDNYYARTHGGGGGGGGNDADALKRKQEEELNNLRREVEGAYAPLQKFYDELKAEYESQIPEANKLIESSLGRGIREYEDLQKEKKAQTEEGKRQIGEAEQNALALARRAYNELKQGFISRFGAGSSAGPAANEILSAATVRQIGGIGKEAQKGFRQLDMELNRTKDFVARKKAELKSMADDKKIEAKNEILNRISQVNNNKAIAENAKATLKIDLLREYQNKIFNIDQTERAYQKQIDMFERQKNAELELAAQQFKTSGTGTGFNVLNTQRAINTIRTATELYGPEVGKQIAKDVFGITGATPLNQSLIWDAARGVWLDPTDPEKVIKPEGLPNPLTGFTTDPKTGLPVVPMAQTQTQAQASTEPGLLSRISNFIGGNILH